MSNETELLLRSVGTRAFGIRYPTDLRLRVTELRKISDAYPSQWQGTTEDGGAIFVRYRRRVLQIGIGANVDAAIDSSLKSPIFEKTLSMAADYGTLEYDELRFLTQALIDWP